MKDIFYGWSNGIDSVSFITVDREAGLIQMILKTKMHFTGGTEETEIPWIEDDVGTGAAHFMGA